MDNQLQQTPTNDELTAAAALLEQKQLAAVNYQEARRNQGGDRPPSLGTTTGAATPATGRRDTNPLEEILGALGNRPGRQDGPPKETPTTGNSEPTGGQNQSSTQASDREKDQFFLLRAAQKAMEHREDQEAEALLQLLAAMFPERQTPREPNTQQGTRDPTTTKEPPTTPKQPTTAPPELPEEGQIKEEGGISFIVGAIPDHTYCGLPTFYNKNVKAMKGSIPLTIFDPVWQSQAAAHHSELRAVLEQPCSTGGRTGTVRPKHLPAGRTGLSDQFLGPVAQDQPGPVGQICPTSWLSLRSDSVRPTTGQTRLFEHRLSSRVRPVNAGSAGEWTQSYAQWSWNYQSFINSLQDVYTFKTFSDWFRVHKDCCDDIMRRKGFCSGLRYDLAVRANVFQCDMVCSKTLCFPNVSLPRPEIQFETSAEAKQNKESSYIDNPYLPGGKKENFNPYTGAEKTNTQNKNNNNNGTNKNKP
ncbi:hypothetical protein PCANC_09375 [Puccinia coronata f. sp. avenae]|uniref:Uncharacterized protein n=1 Tax=Puccinia coronata f. sp. avenae TaxID=200324 RepID=A0A2N5VDC2_9BASI|nr:hypothetical protein PCANC_09375 [Puccinia coronata f. sp. avenae]